MGGPDSSDETAAARAQRAVLAHARHELRSPIGAIIGYAELLTEEAEERGWPHLRDDLGRIGAAGKELLELVNEQLRPERPEFRTGVDMAQVGAAIRHALRTPLGTVTGYADLLIEQAQDQGLSAVIPDLRRISAAGKDLVDLIETIVTFSPGGQAPAGLVAPAAAQMIRSTVEAIPALAAPGAEAHGQPRGTLLLVDDDATNRDLLSRQLARRGHQVVTAENGTQALALLHQHPFDLVLLDVIMPELSGYEVLQRLKGDPALRYVPVIMVSALDELDSVVRCVEAGAEDYLPKPFNNVLLEARVSAALEKKLLRDREQGYLTRLQAEWERSMRLEDHLRRVVRYSLQKPPEGMLAESLQILVDLGHACGGVVFLCEGTRLEVLCAWPPAVSECAAAWDRLAGETTAQSLIIYAGSEDGRGTPEPSAASGSAPVRYVLSVPIPRVIASRQTVSGTEAAGALLLFFAENVLPHLDLAGGRATLGLELSDRHDSKDRLLQELLMILPMLSLGMEIQKLRQTSYQAIHELKNKLIAAKSWTNCLREDLGSVAPAALEDKGVQEDLELSTSAVESGFRLAVSYLQFTRIYDPHLRDCQVNKVLAEAATDIQAFADNHAGPGRVRVALEADATVPVRQFDPDQLKMAFFNLGKNAVEALTEHPVESPRVTLSSQRREGRIAVQVTDNGTGLPPEVAQNLFVAFTTRKEGGTGLGLTITRKIVEVHGGTVTCASSPQGTCFTIVL